MRRFFLRILQLFCLLFLILGIFVVLLPSLLSTDWGRRQVVKGVNDFIPGKIEIRSLQLQWTKTQIIRGFVLKDPKGEVILEMENFSIDAPLWKLLTRIQSMRVGFIQIKGLNATLAVDEKGQNNFQYALGMISTQDRELVSRLSFSHINAHIHLFADYHPFALWVKGITQQQDLEGFFEIDLVLNGLRPSNWKNFMDDIQGYFHCEGCRRAVVQMTVVNFPTDVIDRLFLFKSSYSKQFFRFLIGNHINIALNKVLNTDGKLTAQIQAPLVEGEIKGRLANGAFLLQEPAYLRLNVTPELLQVLPYSHTQLHQLTQINITTPYLFVPLTFLNPQATPDFCQCGFKVEIALDKTKMDFHSLGLLNIHHLIAQINSKSGDSSLYFKWNGYAESDRKPIYIDSERWFEDPSDFSAFLNDPKLTK